MVGAIRRHLSFIPTSLLQFLTGQKRCKCRACTCSTPGLNVLCAPALEKRLRYTTVLKAFSNNTFLERINHCFLLRWLNTTESERMQGLHNFISTCTNFWYAYARSDQLPALKWNVTTIYRYKVQSFEQYDDFGSFKQTSILLTHAYHREDQATTIEWRVVTLLEGFTAITVRIRVGSRLPISGLNWRSRLECMSSWLVQSTRLVPFEGLIWNAPTRLRPSLRERFVANPALFLRNISFYWTPFKAIKE